MKSLLELMNEVYHGLNLDDSQVKYKREKIKGLEDFISDDRACADIIRYQLNADFVSFPDKRDEVYEIAQGRARHSLINYLLGLVFKPFGNLFSLFNTLINEVDENESERLWLLTAIYHDIGYFQKAVLDSSFDYRDNYKKYLYSDPSEEESWLYDFQIKYPRSFAYTYLEIEEYDVYNRKQRLNWKAIEKVNHGILGGAYIFDKSMQKLEKHKSKSRKEILINKAFSLTIGQHNIFKSDRVEDDNELPEILKTKLASTSPFKIGETTPLLFFLCLVDTIECTKKFSKKENDKHSLQTLTVLKRIGAEISETSIEIDLSNLREYILTRPDGEILLEVLEGYKKSILGLGAWTSFSVMEKNGDSFVIERAS